MSVFFFPVISQRFNSSLRHKIVNKCRRVRPESIILLVTDRHGTCFLQNEAALQQGKTVAANSDADLTWLGSLAMAEQKYARMIQVSLKL